MKKIDQNLIKEKLPKKVIEEFKNDIKENEIKMKKLNPNQEKIVSKYSIIGAGLVIGIGIILFILWILLLSSKILILFASITFLAIGGLWVFLIFLIRKKIIDNNLSDLNVQRIFTNWFKLYGVKSEDITFSINIKGEYLKQIKQKRTSPHDARINWISGFYSIIFNGIKSSFVTVKWHWARRVCNSKGYCYTKNYYEDQFFIFDENFDAKWKDLTFYLGKETSLFNKIKKHETLENNQFNKAFEYKYDNPLKVRQIFTLYTQELLLKEFYIKNLRIFKEKEIVVSTCKSKQIASDFNPFRVVISKTLDEKLLKERVANDFVIDFSNLMKTMGHARLLFSLYKK